MLQLKEETERVEAEEKEGRKKLKAKREHAQQWESTRESRVGTWRDFVTKKAPNKVQTVSPRSWDAAEPDVQHVIAARMLRGTVCCPLGPPTCSGCCL